MKGGHNIKDMAGQRFGMLVVLDRAPRKKQAIWRCRCDCGTEVVIPGRSLRNGKTSCGCANPPPNLQHGHTTKFTRSATYKTWASMMSRCTNPHHDAYARYGGRGIRVCKRWHTFEHFAVDMGERPAGKTLDRFPDKDGNYEPGNCRWATSMQQSQNARGVKLTPELVREIRSRANNGESHGDIAEHIGCSRENVSMVARRATWKNVA